MASKVSGEAVSLRRITDPGLWQVSASGVVSGRGSGLAPAVLLGAGASVPYLPVADALKREILRFALALVGAEERLDELAARASQPHVTLEVFCSMLYYRCGGRFQPNELWTALCAGVPASPLVRAVAGLRVAGEVGPILTTNFDQMVVDALTGYGQMADRDFRVVTAWQAAEAVHSTERDVCALHGTIYEVGSGTYAPPLTSLARGLARPLTPDMRRYLMAVLGGPRPVLVLGYSGQDHYDISPVLHELRRAARLRQWLWVCYEDRPDERRRISEILDTDQIVVADASAVLSSIVAGMASPLAAREPPVIDLSIPSWWERLVHALDRFRLPVEGVREFVRDLDENLPGAWVVQEHYRLFSAGFDERTALTFGGVTAPGTVADLSEVAHLSFLSPPQEVPFGDLLNAQFTYRLEDEAHWAGGAAADEVFYPRTTELLANCLAKLQAARGRRQAAPSS
jgi:SIR2-like domain